MNNKTENLKINTNNLKPIQVVKGIEAFDALETFSNSLQDSILLKEIIETLGVNKIEVLSTIENLLERVNNIDSVSNEIYDIKSRVDDIRSELGSAEDVIYTAKSDLEYVESDLSDLEYSHTEGGQDVVPNHTAETEEANKSIRLYFTNALEEELEADRKEREAQREAEAKETVKVNTEEELKQTATKATPSFTDKNIVEEVVKTEEGGSDTI